VFAASSATPGQPSEERIQDADALGLQLARLGRMMTHVKARFVRRQGQETGLESAAYWLLIHLLKDGPQRTTALADAVHSDTSTVSRQVAALVRHGLVERRADPQDGRACLLAATAKGEETLQHHRRLRNEEIAFLLTHWPREDIRQLITLLDRMNTELERYEPQAAHGGEPIRDEGGIR
jgi:DNA-binding MarR family transcriptional regulator